MSPIEERVLVKVREWITFAEEDLKLAKHGLTLASGPYRLLAFLSQQCAEKYLKAYLVSRAVDFPFTHNLRYLRDTIRQNTPWKPEIEDIDYLEFFDILSIIAPMARHCERSEAISP